MLISVELLILPMELVINYPTTVPSNTALILRNMSYKWALMTDEILLNCGLVAMILPLKQADIPTIENLFRNESAISVTLTKLKMNSISLWHAHFITMKERSIKHVYNHSVPCRYHQLKKHTLPWCSVPMATWNFLEPHVNSSMHVLQKESHLCKIITFIV